MLLQSTNIHTDLAKTKYTTKFGWISTATTTLPASQPAAALPASVLKSAAADAVLDDISINASKKNVSQSQKYDRFE